jgi:hypothetical protein
MSVIWVTLAALSGARACLARFRRSRSTKLNSSFEERGTSSVLVMPPSSLTVAFLAVEIALPTMLSDHARYLR